KDVTARATHTMSVCNGAFILASAGLLDGLTATTTAPLIERLGSEFPSVKVVRDRRFVDNGKIITAGGLSSGIDGALHLVSVMNGNGLAQLVALSLEYDWRPQAGFARPALADTLIPDLGLDGRAGWKVVNTEGGTDRWELSVRGPSDLTAQGLRDELERVLATKGKWTRVGAGGEAASSNPTSHWKLTGPDGQAWSGTLPVGPRPPHPPQPP